MTRVLADLREKLKPFYSEAGRPSIDPELMLRMLIVGYCYGIRFERKLCEEVELHLAYRWFCCLALDDKVPITRRSLVFRTAPDSCRKRAAPALTFSANRRHSARGSGREEPARRRRSRTDAAAFTTMAHEAFSDRSSIFAILSQPRSNVKVPALPAGSCILTMRDRTESSACSTT